MEKPSRSIAAITIAIGRPLNFTRTTAACFPAAIAILSICKATASKAFNPNILLCLPVLLGDMRCEERQDRIFAIHSIAGLEKLER